MTTLPDNGEMEGSRLYTLGGVLPGISWDKFEQLDYLYSIFFLGCLFVCEQLDFKGHAGPP